MKDFSYKRTIEYCVDRLLKAKKTAYLREWKPDGMPKALSKLKAPEINQLFLGALTEDRAKEIYQANRGKFGFTDWDVKTFFKVELCSNQLIRLAKRGKIEVVGRYCSPMSSFETDMYAPDGFASLTDEDLQISDDPIWITQTTLLSWGWTKSLIEQFLPEPLLKPNPMYKTAPPSKNWDSDEVRQIMLTPEFKEARERAARRGTGAAKAVQTKRNRLMEQVQQKIRGISVDASYTDEELVKSAIADRQAWYNYIAMERGRWYDGEAADADEATVRRWVVNFIRHNLTDYDDDLYGLAGKVGCHEGYRKYKNAVLDRIAEAYPKYVDECCRQKGA